VAAGEIVRRWTRASAAGGKEGEPPRVLHAPIEIAGQGSIAVRGLRELGVDAHLFAAAHPFGYDEPDIIPPSTPWAYIRTFAAAVRAHDVIHFYYGAGFLPVLRLVDVRALRALGKQIVVEFFGSDVRIPSLASARNPHYVQLRGEDDDLARRRMRSWSRLTSGHMIVGDHSIDASIGPYFKHVHYARQRVDTASWVPRPPATDCSRPRVVHAPSDFAGKGTRFVRRAVEELRGSGMQFEYDEISGSSHAEVMRHCESADLVVDQLCVGSHGVFSVEAMSMAKPVICNLLPAYRATLPASCPIISADPDSITDVLRRHLEDAELRHRIGIASRAYAVANHDMRVVARMLLEAYDQLPRR
jgi:hypothetical protein